MRSNADWRGGVRDVVTGSPLLDDVPTRHYVTPMRTHLSSRFRRLTAATVLALTTAVPVGCNDDELADGVTDSAFVAAMAELERIDREPGADSAARVAARTAALQRRGLTPARLEAAAASLADDPAHALAIYRAIDAKAGVDPASETRRAPGAPATPGAPAGPARR